MLRELLDPERLGKRGEVWFLAQLAGVALVLFPPGGVRQVVDALGVAGIAGGVALLVAGGISLGQLLTPVPAPRDDHTLVTRDAFELARHPMYGGLILAAAGLAVASGDEARLALAAALFWVLDRKASYEEELLEERYGEEYRVYKQRVKKFIPWLY